MSTLCDVDAVASVCWCRDLRSLAVAPLNPKDYDISHTGFWRTWLWRSGTVTDRSVGAGKEQANVRHTAPLT
jgi:hypothetical protein